MLPPLRVHFSQTSSPFLYFSTKFRNCISLTLLTYTELPASQYLWALLYRERLIRFIGPNGINGKASSQLFRDLALTCTWLLMDPAAHNPQRNIMKTDSMPQGRRCKEHLHARLPIAPKLLFPFPPFIFPFQERINILKFVMLTKRYEVTGISIEEKNDRY